ncbi:hypothetical protein IAU60_005327 [Kwoniella sp. DSM 27419]
MGASLSCIDELPVAISRQRQSTPFSKRSKITLPHTPPSSASPPAILAYTARKDQNVAILNPTGRASPQQRSSLAKRRRLSSASDIVPIRSPRNPYPTPESDRIETSSPHLASLPYSSSTLHSSSRLVRPTQPPSRRKRRSTGGSRSDPIVVLDDDECGEDEPEAMTHRSLNQVPPVQMISIENKGRGLVALGRIERGTLIIRERPFYVIPLEVENEEVSYEQIHLHYYYLSSIDKARFHELFPTMDDLFIPEDLEYFVNTNSIPLHATSEEAITKLGLFRLMCLINHSCTPNATWKWYEEENRLHLYALTDIPFGTEITVSYLSSPIGTYAERQAELMRSFGFRCACEACSEPLSVLRRSDMARRLYKSLLRGWEQPVADAAANLSKCIRELDRALEILKEQKLWDEMGQTYGLMFESYAIHGKFIRAKEAARKAFAHYTMTYGLVKAKQMPYAKQAHNPMAYVNWSLLCPDSEDEADERRIERKRKLREGKQESKSALLWYQDSEFVFKKKRL